MSKPRGAAAGPLRKIVDHALREPGLWYEVLECGHEYLQKEDMIGPTNAARRRCFRCRNEAAAKAKRDARVAARLESIS